MKKTYLIILIAVILLAGVLYFSDRNKDTEEASVNVSQSVDGQYCFSRYQAATDRDPYEVEEHVVLNISGNEVIGKKRGTQNGPDMTNGYEGDLIGSKNGNNLDLIYSFTIEGSKNEELEIYELRTGELVKMRWALKEEGEMLVPDKVGSPTLIHYLKEDCSQEE